MSGDLLLLAKDRKDIWNRFFLYRVLHFKSLRARAEERAKLAPHMTLFFPSYLKRCFLRWSFLSHNGP